VEDIDMIGIAVIKPNGEVEEKGKPLSSLGPNIQSILAVTNSATFELKDGMFVSYAHKNSIFGRLSDERSS
jgi:hypothetical protein